MSKTPNPFSRKLLINTHSHKINFQTALATKKYNFLFNVCLWIFGVPAENKLCKWLVFKTLKINCAGK